MPQYYRQAKTKAPCCCSESWTGIINRIFKAKLFLSNRIVLLRTSWTGVPRLGCSPLWIDGQKHHVEIPSPVSSDGSACACCLPRAVVQAEHKTAPSVWGCQPVSQHWNRGSACTREGKATSLLPSVWEISSCALSQQQRKTPQKQIQLQYLVGSVSTPPPSSCLSSGFQSGQTIRRGHRATSACRSIWPLPSLLRHWQCPTWAPGREVDQERTTPTKSSIKSHLSRAKKWHQEGCTNAGA